MKNALVKVFKNADPEALAAKVDTLEKRRAALTAELADNERVRRELALPTADGDPKAMAAFNQARADMTKLHDQIDALTLAIMQTNRDLSEARKNILKDERQAEIHLQRKDCTARLKAAKEAEDALRALDASMGRMEDIGIRIEARYRKLKLGQRSGERPFARVNVEVRLAQFAYGIGLVDRISALGKYVSSAAPVRGFVEHEAEEQKFYEDLDAPPDETADEPQDKPRDEQVA